MKRLIIAGVQSGVGKTTISIAIMRSLTNSGRNVAPFKVGPDYIDPKFHKFVTGNYSYNLDSWMLEEDIARYLFKKNSYNKDIAIIEGVMGLYDGCGTDTIGSTAHVAKLLDAPVILVLDARGMSTSVAAMVSGYKNYDNEVELKGVIFNRVSGDRHYSLLKEVVERDTGVECLGYLPSNAELTFKSRHLGLVPVEELKDIEKKIDLLSKDAEKHIDMNRLEEIASCDGNDFEHNEHNIEIELNNIGRGLKIAIAMDEAFNFYYQDNLDLMAEAGVELIEFSPLHDKRVPEAIDGLYIGGGFPEVFAEKLSKNSTMIEDIRTKAENNMPVYAECGGLMYLTGGIIDKNSNIYPMVDFFKCKTRMTKKLQRFGYAEIEYDGINIKAHEFHHTALEDIKDSDITYKYIVKKTGKDEKWECGLSKKNVLAGYAHIHFYSNREFFKKIIALYKRIHSTAS